MTFFPETRRDEADDLRHHIKRSSILIVQICTLLHVCCVIGVTCRGICESDRKPCAAELVVLRCCSADDFELAGGGGGDVMQGGRIFRSR